MSIKNNYKSASSNDKADHMIELTGEITRSKAISILKTIKVFKKEPRFTQRTRLNPSNKVNTFLYPNSLLSLSNDVYKGFSDELSGFSKYYEVLRQRYTADSDLTTDTYTSKQTLLPLSINKDFLNNYNIHNVNSSFYVKSDRDENVANFIRWVLYNSTSTSPSLIDKREETEEKTNEDTYVENTPSEIRFGGTGKTYSLSISNLSKFIHKIKGEPTKIHVVSHSDVMQGFVDNYLSLLENNKGISPDCTATNNTSDNSCYKTIPFVITRHAYSCNNALEKYPMSKNFEPALTAYGIWTAYKHGDKNAALYTSKTVFVSCLLRTWETAVLLYLPNLKQSDTLLLIVSPFLKETHGTLKKLGQSRGNYPAFIFQQLQLFHMFLSYCLVLEIPIQNRKICLYVNRKFHVDITIGNNSKIDWTLHYTENDSSEYFTLEMVNYVSNTLGEIKETTEESSNGFNSNTSTFQQKMQHSKSEDFYDVPEEILGGEKNPMFSTNLWHMEFDIVCYMSNSKIIPLIDNISIVSGAPKPDDTITNTLACNPLCLSNNRLSTRIQKCDSQMKNVFGQNIVGQKFTKRAWYNPKRYLLGKFKENENVQPGGGRKTKRRKISKTRKIRRTKK